MSIDFDKTTYKTYNLEDINVGDTILIEDVSFGYPDNYIELIVESVNTTRSERFIPLMRDFQEIIKISTNSRENISYNGDLSGAINIYKKYNIYTQDELKSGNLNLSFQNLDLSGDLTFSKEVNISTEREIARISIGCSKYSKYQYGKNSIAIGNHTGRIDQGENSIAIGTKAGVFNQHDNSIIINANTEILNSCVSGGLFINPMQETNYINNDGPNNTLIYNKYTKNFKF